MRELANKLNSLASTCDTRTLTLQQAKIAQQ
jgi:hypothetical protein